MNISFKLLRNIAIFLGVLTFFWMMYDYFKNYDDQVPLYKKANDSFLKKNYGEALLLYSKVYENNKNNIYALEGQARCLFRLKLYSKAEEKFKEVIRKEDSFIPGFANLGILYDTIGEYKKAIYYYDVAISKDKKIAEGMKWFNRFLKNIQYKPSNIKERRDYLKQQLLLKKDRRKLKDPNLDSLQPDFQM